MLREKIDGYKFLYNSNKYNMIKKLPSDMFIISQPAIDNNGNKLDKDWYAVYQKIDNISNLFNSLIKN